MRIRHIYNKIIGLYYKRKILKTGKKIGKGLYLGGKSYVTNNTILGDHVNFNGMSMSGKGKITIGNYFHSGVGCQIITSFHNYEGEEIPYDYTYIDKDVDIGDFVWLGNNVIILGGCTIGKGAIIQAGSVVVNDIPDYGIAGGHPAKVFKYRNIEKFNKLEKEHKYH
ncbi:acyltransferase [Ligilactobacillus salivarius]|uniref:acyltransferase n=1 Tax=Ligilactobacillus salivarius TaxID=1624 RepID=UPI00236819A7|nr:acyltransferase [Ligilactobacillus salivarius]